VLAAVLGDLDHPGALGMTWPLPAQYLAALVPLAAGAVTTLGWLRHRDARWGVAIVACQLLTLVPLAATYNPVRRAEEFYPRPKAIEWLQDHVDGRALMPGHVGTVYRIALAQGYDGMTPRRVEQLIGPVGAGDAVAAGFFENPLALWGSEPLSAVTVLRSGLSDLFSVRYLLLPPGAQLSRPDIHVVYDGPDARIFEHSRALPRAFLVGRARCAGDAEAMALLRTRALDIRREVILTGCNTPTQGETPAAGDTVEIRPSPDDRVRIRVSSAGPAYLVVTDTWFPGWRATVSGSETVVWRANYAFRAVRVPGGQHEVEFVFRPRGFREGLIITLLALASTLAVAVIGSRRGRRGDG
jgi:hypothetical protein